MRQVAITRAVSVAAAVVIVGTLLILTHQPDAQSFATNDERYFVQCGTSGIPPFDAQVDPIVAPGTTSAHMHTFFGNTRTTSDPSYDRMTAAPLASNCDTRRDTAAYWVPQAMNSTTGVMVAPTTMNVYYVNTAKSSAMQPFPAGFQAVSNDIEILGPGSNAEAGPGVRVWFRRQCWDGTLHMTSPAEYVAHTLLKTSGCPAGYTLLPKLHFNARWRTLSSLAGYEPGATTGWHGDFWNTWHQPTQEALTAACLRPTRVAAGCGRVTDANIAKILGDRGIPLPPLPTATPTPTPTPTTTPTVDPAVQALLDLYAALTPEQQAAFKAAIA